MSVMQTKPMQREEIEDSTEGIENMYSRHLIMSVCDIKQWALDFNGNYNRIRGSILECIRQRSSYRLGPELETCGYTCEDHFLELDTLHHNYELIARLLRDVELYGIVIDLGCLIHHRGVRYNGRAIILDGKIICIRPKTILANDSNYHEGRWFTPWRKKEIEQWIVPPVIKKVTGQDLVPIGVCLVQFLDTCIGFEICEELFVPNNLHQIQVLNGAEIITNGSGSHFQRGKLGARFDLVLAATKRCGCAYLYSNLVGCDGGRLYFDGGSFISSCGKLLEFIPRFSLCPEGYAVRSAYIDLDEVKGKRSSIMSWASVASDARVIPKIRVDRNICLQDCFTPGTIYKKSFDDPTMAYKLCDDIEELINAPVCWIWDYLLRSGLSGCYLSLSGGADSTATAGLIYMLCGKIFDELSDQPKTDYSRLLLSQLRSIVKDNTFVPTSSKDICNRMLVTNYMATNQSSVASKQRAEAVAKEIGCVFYDSNIQSICDDVISTVSKSLSISEPKFAVCGGTHNEDTSLQNVQARIRSVVAYATAQLYMQTKSNKASGSLIVVGSANADETITGYFTKYDCSSADVNIIGDLSKHDIRQILGFMCEKHNLQSIREVLKAIPSAELTPVCDNNSAGQSDEAELGITYEQIKYLRYLRKVELCGPVSMFRRACHYWFREQNEFNLKPYDIAQVIKRFFIRYCMNRHKATILPPSVHLDAATPDDNRGDFRPFLYNVDWEWQFKHIDLLLEIMENDSDEGSSGITSNGHHLSKEQK